MVLPSKWSALSSHHSGSVSAFAADWLAGLYGGDIRKSVGRSHATRWSSDPLIRGGWSAASPGGAGSRAVLREALGGRLWFAGEAAHDTAWGSVEGAWESGERAATEILRSFGVLRDEPAAKAKAPAKRSPAKRQQF
jgi:monoamine oxidase